VAGKEGAWTLIPPETVKTFSAALEEPFQKGVGKGNDGKFYGIKALTLYGNDVPFYFYPGR